LIVAGVMSGTSADGINVALIRVHPGRRAGRRFDLLAHENFPYPPAVRRKILDSMNSDRSSVAELARLNFLLGELYADAVLRTRRRVNAKLALVGCHGQTLYHQGEAAPFLGRRVAATWQTGEGAMVAARLGTPVVSDFRPADIAAGGKGAPLVPFLDYQVYRHPRIGRVIQNIGGIANFTAIPAQAKAEEVIAFDSGPGNMLIDALCERLYGRSYDRDGRIAAKGRVLAPLLTHALRHPFFGKSPPKTAGHEEFGREFAKEFVRRARGSSKPDIVATATALTAYSIADAVGRFVPRRSKMGEMIVSGGGTRNVTLMAMLADQLRPLGMRLLMSDDFGVPAEAKEAIAFALLAYETWNRRPSNLPSATGARKPAILGKISYA
jgi:anhydro-N-acetylmuramic acid kinase